MNGKFIFWSFHQAHWSHCTRDSEKHSGSVILWDLTEAPPTPNEDIISEGVKGCVKCTLWLAGCQKDLHDWTRCFWRILYDPGMIYIPGLGSGFRDSFNDCGKKRKHLYSRGISHGQDLGVSELKVPSLVHFGVQTQQLQYVIFIKKPTEHPGIFHCTSWESVSNF